MKKVKRKDDLMKLRLVTPPITSHDEPLAVVTSIGYDSECDTYYIDPAGGGKIEYKPLPANFHTHELMSVDPSDENSLFEFQREWGLLTTPRREPLRMDTLGTPTMTMVTPIEGMSDAESFEEASRLYKHLCDRHKGFQEVSSAMMILESQGHNGIYTFAPAAEAKATLSYLKTTVEKLITAHVTGFDNWGGIEGRNLRSLIGEIDAAIEPYYPRYRMIEPSLDGRTVTPPALPLTIAVLVQLLSYIASEEGYRECKQCHRYFLYKRHAAGEIVRNRRSIYCSSECKARASSSAQAARRKAARLAQRKEIG